MIVFSSPEMHKLFTITLNAFSCLMFFIILATMGHIPIEKNKSKILFILCGVFGFVTTISDICAAVLLNNNELCVAYKIVCYIDMAFFMMFSISKSMFMLHYSDEGKNSTKIFKIIITFAYSSLILFSLLPDVANKIFTIPDNSANFVIGPWGIQFFALFGLVGFVVLLDVISNWSFLGLSDSILLIAFELFPLLSFVFFDPEQAPSLCFFSVFMMYIYIRIFQGRLWEASEKEKQYMKDQIQLSDMRTKVVLSQVKPHFLYNTLTSIAYYCKKDPDIAKNLTMDFSSYLRSHVDNLGAEGNILFSKELENTKTYLNIEQIRFGDRLRVHFDIQFSNFTVPSLMLQPIVENAVKHGVCKRIEGGNVWISTEKTDKNIEIIVRDDGVGFDKNKIKSDGRTHIGIENVRERLEKLCGGVMLIDSKIGEGTTVKLLIPLEVKL